MNSVSALACSAPNSNENWWQGAVIYQIYPRSFQDNNDDGIGDLNGITSRLEYIADLGVDAIWISPFFKSPMKDFGYDVSDYREIDPMFGTMEDFDSMLARAHELGLRVMIDLVLSHTSDAHEWFKESRASRDNSKSDWYVWADPKPDGTPPNNWLSLFGGSAWQWDTRREQYYLHNFLTSQPDLNFHNPEVQNALLDLTRFWLEKGVDGFRLDTINFYFHDAELRDNPALPVDERNATIAPSVNPYNHQNHLYSKNRPENLDFLKRYRDLLNEYEGRTLLGEVGDAQYGLEIMGQYTAGGERAHMCYAFEFLQGNRASASWVKDVFGRISEVAADGWACWAFSNHDVKRHVTRWNLSDEAARAYAALMMCLRGSACIYQGEELGFAEAEVAFEDLQDPYGIEFWPEFKGRDGCRTPMVWDHSQNGGGFSLQKGWLPLYGEHFKSAVDRQLGQVGSMHGHYKNVIALRKELPALAVGTIENIGIDGDILSFTRTEAEQNVHCVFNLSDTPVDIEPLEGAAPKTAISGRVSPNSTQLEPWQYVLSIQ